MKLIALRRMRPEVILVLEVIAYSAIFSCLTILKFQAFGTYAWDMGVYNQAFSTTLRHGDLFFSTVELPSTSTLMPKGTILSVHLSPVLFLILPFYALFPSPFTLLVMQSTILGLGAVPVYLLARKELDSSLLALGFSTAYLLSPVLHGINWYDFHAHAFFPTFILFTLLFLERNKVSLCALFLLLSLATIEIAAPLGLIIGVVTLWIFRARFLDVLKKYKARVLLRFAPITVILISLIWLVVSYLMIISLGWLSAFHPSALLRRFTVLGAKSTIDIPFQILLNPLSVEKALSFDWQAKVLYLLIIFGSFAFLSVLDVPRLSLAIIWPAFALLSNCPPFYQIGDQYPAFVLPFVAYSAIFGMKKLANNARISLRLLSNAKKASEPIVCVALTSIILCSSLTSTYLASPLGPLHYVNFPGASPFMIPVISQHEEMLYKIIALVPQKSSILTQNNIFPHFSNRKNAYVFPFSATFGHPSDFDAWLDTYLQNVDFILVDARDQVSSALIFSRADLSEDFGIYGAADGIVLFKRGYKDQPPVLFEPIREVFTHSDLRLQMGSIVSDPSSDTGKVMYHNSSLESPSDFWYGPGVFLLPGDYCANFRLRISSDSVGYIMKLAVVAWPALLEYRTEGWEQAGFTIAISVKSATQEMIFTEQVDKDNFTSWDNYQTLPIYFKTAKPAMGVEFVGLSVRPGIGVYLDYVELVQSRIEW
jgi:uncharacterized membrane protein